MKKALLEAKKAFNKNEVPIGAIIVSSVGKIISRGYNQVEERLCQTAHAEVIAIERACKKVGGWRLDGFTIYITIKPCTMCMGLILHSRINKIVYGGDSPVFGYQLDNDELVPKYRKDKIKIVENILEAETSFLMKDFFKNKRD